MRSPLLTLAKQQLRGVGPRRFATAIALTIMLVCTIAGSAWAADYVTKFACVAPDGSLWVKLTKDWDRELRERTGGEARIQLFAGGILGEEFDAIRKMRVGQIHATGVTGIGMGALVSETRVFEMPRLFRNFEEIDAARKRLESFFEEAFDARGYVLMGFTEVGPIHIFTKKPVKQVEDLNQQRMWVFEGDPVSRELVDAFGVSAVPLTLLNVLPSLQTGVIDGVYGSPLAAVTMQWNSYLKYMTAQPLAYGMGVIAMDKKFFETLPPNIQEIQRELGRKYTRAMIEKARTDNERAVELMKERGLQVIPLPANEAAQLDQRARSIWPRVGEKLFKPELLAQVEAATLEVRTKKGEAP